MRRDTSCVECGTGIPGNAHRLCKRHWDNRTCENCGPKPTAWDSWSLCVGCEGPRHECCYRHCPACATKISRVEASIGQAVVLIRKNPNLFKPEEKLYSEVKRLTEDKRCVVVYDGVRETTIPLGEIEFSK